MAVLINCFILCVCQFSSAQPSQVKMPITSLAYNTSPINPKSLSLSFSTNDNMDSKKTNNVEVFKPVKTSPSTQDEELSKKTVSVSRLLSKLGLISNNDLTPKDVIFSKQNQNVDPNILYDVSSPPQKNVPNLKTHINEKYDVPKDPKINKNTVNYNINVISPPAVFKNLPRSLPMNQNVEGSTMLSKTDKYSKNVPTTPLLSYPVRSPTEERNQESTAAWPIVRKTFSNNEDGTKYKIVKPLIQKNTITIDDDDARRSKIKTENIAVPPKANEKLTFDYDINNRPFEIDSRSNNLFDHQFPKTYLDTPYIQNHVTLPILPEINQEIKPPPHTLSTHVTETLPKLSSPFSEISKPQHIYSSEYDTFNFHLGTSLDNILSFLKSTLVLAISDSSAANSLRTPTLSSAPELLQPHITDAPVKLSKKPVFEATYPEVDSPTYLPKSKVDIPLKNTHNAIKKSINEYPVPYISSVTINYMPCIESTNEIIIFV